MRGIWLLFIAAVIASFAAGVATGTHWPATSAARPAAIDDDGTQEFDRHLAEHLAPPAPPLMPHGMKMRTPGHK